MKQKNLRKKVCSLLVASSMLVGTFPMFSTSIYAESSKLPKEKFATVDDLKSFNTDDDIDGKNPARVYFGNNNQQWWIVGSQQEKGVTLFATSPLGKAKFEENNKNKEYNDSWKCTYQNGNPKEVFPNHYGGSTIREKLISLEESYFTESEKNSMNETTIYTKDIKNDSVYSTTDKLYLAYGIYGESNITAGKNNINNLNDALIINNSYLKNKEDYNYKEDDFWLRTPNEIPIGQDSTYNSSYATKVSPGPGTAGGPIHSGVIYEESLVPVFELNLSSIIFASAIPTVSSEGILSLEDTTSINKNGAFTLRYKADNLGSAEVSYDKSKVTLTGIPTDKDVYLVVQNNAGAYAKKITTETEVSASSMGLDSFENCKVWLETTDTTNRITYATLATEEPKYTIVADKSSLDFGSKDKGYNTDKLSQILKITNTGNSKVTLKDITVSKYDVTISNKEIEPQGESTITVVPKKDLAVGEHNEKITIATEQGTSVEINAKFKVNSVYVPSIPSKPDEKPDEDFKINISARISGETRYDTSIEISKKSYPSKSKKVYLVSGEKFPDALSAASLSGKDDGPILLINDKNIDKVLSEIDRLDSKEIVFIGGNSISDTNKAKVKKFAKENSVVVKSIVGEGRYETSVKVAEQTIAKYGNKGKVIIADGRNYPDAVSIAPYSSKERIPVILVNGNKVPKVVESFLNKYKIKEAIFVGGDKAVGKDVEKLFTKVERIAGENRYETSKKIAERFFEKSKVVILASGESFADSLSVSYYASMKNAPVLLTKSDSLDDSTKEYLDDNKDKDYIIVGGEEAINSDIFK